MIKIADENTVDYIKFQLYSSDNLNPLYPNFRETQARLKSAELNFQDVLHIMGLCKTLKITPMFTIFDVKRIEWLVESCYNDSFALKVASPDLGNDGLIQKLVKCFPQKEILISCGMHTGIEITDIRERYKQYDNVKWLYCKSMYPTPYGCIDFEKMKTFDGFSDHTIGLDAIRTAIIEVPELQYFEKHFTLSKNLPIKDKDWSVEPGELKDLMALVKYNENTKNYKERFKAC